MTSICVLTGAGISTASGIPDFRGPQGLWTRDPTAAALVDYDVFVNDPAVRRASWLDHRDSAAWTAEPNAAHRSLVALEKAGLLTAIITQNIDRLHHFAGSSPQRVIELHGNMFDAVCINCGEASATAQALARLEEGDTDLRCLDCGGIIKTATIMFGQRLDPVVLERAFDATRSVSHFVVVGSSLQVEPAAGMAELAHHHGAEVIVVNAEPTSADHLATRIERGDITEVLPALVAEWIAAG